MKTKTLLAIIVPGLIVIQACQNNNKTGEKEPARANPRISQVITDTTALNRGAPMSVFMNAAALSGMIETELGKIAAQKSANRLIRDFSEKIVKDHIKIAKRLKKLAESKRMTLPAAIPEAEQAHIDEIRKLSGPDFDRHYVDMMIKQHVKALDLFKSASTLGDTPLQNFAATTLRVLETHYKMATAIDKKLK